jgi:3-oxoadipate enol-lactonase
MGMMEKPISLFHLDGGTGIPIIFLHGYPLDHRIWLPTMMHLGMDVRCILPDLRGYGETEVPPGIYSMEVMAQDVKELMDDLKLEKAILIGHSMGGYVAFQFWKLFPERLSGLGLIASRSKADTPSLKVERLQVAQQVEKSGSVVVIDPMLTKLTARQDLVPELRQIMTGINPMAIAATLRGIATRADATAWLHLIDIPCLVVAGQDDQIVPLTEAIEMAKGLRAAELCVIKGAGHMPMMEDPIKTAEAIYTLANRVKK